MAKKGKKRTMSIDLTMIPDSHIKKHENGRLYVQIETWDKDEPDRFGNDFSVSLSKTKAEIEKKEAGGDVPIVFLGNGKVWPDKEMQTATAEEVADKLPWMKGAGDTSTAPPPTSDDAPKA